MKRHDLDLLSLIFGLLFTAIAGWYFVSRYLNVDLNLPHLPNGGWFVATALIVLGVLGVAASLRRSRDDHRDHSLDD